ncbi:helix-turn-helix domain-containing protein [Anaeromicropila populeti]|uniref:Helix-turn-helix n=1 Tax=Anaeromicropila populeti TaxID=37658 RepID=A0A1I6IKH8_9FIRM|nr:helix-turn-helix domain-containing protein [Anaeromicropila populeti]SFR67159.1 Helix-turn-helix [Anaeromicropila populeti]
MNIIATRIKKAMDIRNMRQVDVIEKSGINKGSLSSYLSGKYIPKQSNIIRLASALNVAEAWLSGQDVPMERIDYSSALEVHESFDSLSEMDIKLLDYFSRLNETGKAEALKRICELTYLYSYTESNS